MKKYDMRLEKWTHSQTTFKCVKTHDSRVRDLVSSTNRERRGVDEADKTYVDPSAVGVHNENSDDIWGFCICSLMRGLCYAMHVRRYILLANICSDYTHLLIAFSAWVFLFLFFFFKSCNKGILWILVFPET